MIKRLRIFAGPNGSGKSTFIKNFPALPNKNIKLGFYVNADDIERSLREEYFIDLSEFGISITTNQIQEYFKRSTFSPVKLSNPHLWEYFSIENNILKINRALSINSYIAADLAELIRQTLLDNKLSFSYETVMSDEKKIDFLHAAKAAGYRIYLYYFATEDPIINVNRVKLRVAQHGHPVDPAIIESRYYKSLANLKAAVKVSKRAYLFDNSNLSILIAEITNGTEVDLIDQNIIPNWFRKYLIE